MGHSGQGDTDICWLVPGGASGPIMFATNPQEPLLQRDQENKNLKDELLTGSRL